MVSQHEILKAAAVGDGAGALGNSTAVGGDCADSLTSEIVVERDLAACMRDGVTLYADVYRPRESGRFPALLMRTPYGKEGSSLLATTISAVRRGYVVLVQDVRGLGKSEGRWVPHFQERNDGYDTIEWVASLPYVNGKVGTLGVSYLAEAQWVTAPTRPQHLLAVAPTMNYASHKHFFFEGGVFRTTFMKAILALQARERAQLGLPIISDEAWAHGGESWMTHLPLAELPLMKEFPYWAEWVNNPVESDYWKPVDIEAQHDQITVPALNITGWHDDYYGQPGAIRNFEGMRAGGGSDRARRGQRLIIGPWSHGDPSLTNTSALGVDYGLNAGIDFIELQLRFFDYWLKGIDDGYTKEPPVRIFVMGDNVWRDEHEWPLARTRYTDLHLNTGGVLAAAAPTADSSDTFVYDPRHPLRIPHLDASGKGVAVDWDSVISRDDVLTYTSAPFDSDTEITGQILAKLWISSTAPDTDFSARVLVVEPSGHMCPLTRDPGMLRARYRNTEDLQPPRPLTPSEPTELTISLGYTSYVIKSGHRLRVFVAGSVFPAVHLNVWGPFTSMSQAVMAKQTVHHTPVHASKIVLPVVPR